MKNIKKNKDFEKNLSENEVLNDFETLLDNSVKKQLISDVPIGAFLSGGVDSSLILSQLIKHKSDVETFNIGFEFSNYDESEDANQVAKLFNTNHHNHICTKNEALNLIPDISSAFSEPFADSSQIPTMLVSKVASQQVKVILGGDGGDEIFGGYNRYLLAQKYWKIFKIFPYPINKILNLYKFIPKKILFLFFDNFLKLKNFSKNKHSSYEKILKKISNISDKKSFYENLTKEWMNDKILNYEPTESKIKSYEHSESDLSFEEWMMAIDFDTYMTDDILCKVDRASMFYSLEARSPLLSKSLVEYMFKLPLKYKINNGITKSIPKKLLSKYLPKEYIYKPKQGFGVPLAEWFRRDLKTYVFDNLSKNMCDRHSLFNHNEINKTLKDHFEKNIDCEHKLWSLMQFNLWYNNTFNK